MTEQTRKVVLGAVVAVAVVAIGLVVWRQASDSSAADNRSNTVTVLCANEKCGYSGEAESKKLVFAGGANDQPAQAPAYGLGYKCPKCGKNSLYMEPMKCGSCGTLFLPRLDASGAMVQNCPKCGKS